MQSSSYNVIMYYRAAVQSCPEEVEEMEAGVTATSAEERQRQLEARHENIRLITGMLINTMELLPSLICTSTIHQCSVVETLVFSV